MSSHSKVNTGISNTGIRIAHTIQDDYLKGGDNLSWNTAGNSHKGGLGSSQELDTNSEPISDSKNSASQEEMLTNSSLGSLDQELMFSDSIGVTGNCEVAADLDKELANDIDDIRHPGKKPHASNSTTKPNNETKYIDHSASHMSSSHGNMYVRSIGQNGGTQSGFNSIGHQTRRHNQWHSRGQNVSSTGNNRSGKPGGGGASNRVYQSRNTSSGANKKTGVGSSNVAQSKNNSNIRRRAKNPIPSKETTSSLEQEPSGWGDLPPPSTNSDIGTSAWGNPTETRGQVNNGGSGGGWGDTALWSARTRDSNGTRAAGWHREGVKVSPNTQIEKLLEMGFEKEDATKALKSNNYNFDSALGDLLALMSINESLPTPTESEVADIPSTAQPPTAEVTSVFTSQSPSNPVSNTNPTFALPKQSQGTLDQQLQWQQVYGLPTQSGVVAPGQVGSVPVGSISPATHIRPLVPGGTGINMPVKNNAVQDQIQFQGNKVHSQILQQQLSHQALLMQQLARMPPQIVNLKIQIAQFQVLQQQLMQRHLQLKAMGNTSQAVVQRQQVMQQILQIKQILQNLQQQLVSSSQQLQSQPATLKGNPLPGVPPPVAVGGPMQNMFTANRPTKATSLTQPISTLASIDPKVSTSTVTNPPGHKTIPNRSISAPSAPSISSEGNKRSLPKLDISFFPDAIPEFHPGKPWQPRPKPTEPAQVYGSKASTSVTQVMTNPAISKLSPQAKPFTLSSWETGKDKHESTKMADQRPNTDQNADIMNTLPSSQSDKTLGSRPQLLTLSNDSVEPVMPTYCLSTTPLTSVWSKSSSGNRDPTAKMQMESGTIVDHHSSLWESNFDTVSSPECGDPWSQMAVLSPNSTNPEVSLSSWQNTKKQALGPNVFKHPSNPPSSWLLIKDLHAEVNPDEFKATCSEYGETQNIFFNDAKRVALVCFQNKENAALAKAGLDKTLLNGVAIVSDFATDEDIGNFFSEMSSPRVLSPNTLSAMVSSKGENQISTETNDPWPYSQDTPTSEDHSDLIQPPDNMSTSKWSGPPLSIPKSEVAQLWSMGNFDTLMNYSAPTPTTPEADDWNYISSSPLTKFLPGGLF